MVGQWTTHAIEQTEAAGQRATDLKRKETAELVSKTAVVGDVVAMFTHDDVTPRRTFWLADIVSPATKVSTSGGITCGESGMHFNKNDEVVTVKYWDRIGLAPEHDNVFHRSDPREYIIPTRGLRKGKIQLVKAATQSRVRSALERFEFTADDCADLHKTINEICKDE